MQSLILHLYSDSLMESDRRTKRTVIWFLWKQGKSQAEIHSDMLPVFGAECPAKSTIHEWVSRFVQGQENIEDEERSGRPETATDARTVLSVQKALDDDRRLTLREIAEAFNISYGSAHTIVGSILEMTRVSARWVPKLLTDSQKEDRVRICELLLQQYRDTPDLLPAIVTGDESWLHYYAPETKAQSSAYKKRGEAAPVKAKTTPSAGKRMATVFWDRDGILLIKWLPEGHTVTGNYYVQVLTELREKIKSERRGKLTHGVWILHDNARAHTCQQTTKAIHDLGFRQLPHPPYSPDLAPSDYWLFSKMKEPLRGKNYADLQALASAVSQWVRATPKEFFAAGIDKLPERWQKCISVAGSYIEKTDIHSD